MMTQPAHESHSVILRIARLLVACPDALRLNLQEGTDGAIYWVLTTLHAADEPKLIGDDGTHVDAMRFLVTQMGRADGLAFTFRLVTETGKTEREHAEQVVATKFDERDARDFLVEILTQLDIGEFMVRIDNDAGQRTTLAFRFAVVLTNPADWAALTVQRKFRHGRGETMSIEQALSMLFRAAGKAAGVRLKIVVEEPT